MSRDNSVEAKIKREHTRRYTNATNGPTKGTTDKIGVGTGRCARDAIVCFCLECVGGNRGDVTGCTDEACFLWPYRKGNYMKRPDEN